MAVPKHLRDYGAILDTYLLNGLKGEEIRELENRASTLTENLADFG